jgi:diacylglycerol kinase (ATP)
MEALLKAWQNSSAGFRRAVASERAVRQEFYVLVATLPLAFLVGADMWKRALLVASVLIVLAVELLNTAIEKLCDHITPQIHPTIKFVKDLGSAAVLAAIFASGLLWLAALAERLGWH